MNDFVYEEEEWVTALAYGRLFFGRRVVRVVGYPASGSYLSPVYEHQRLMTSQGMACSLSIPFLLPSFNKLPLNDDYFVMSFLDYSLGEREVFKKWIEGAQADEGRLRAQYSPIKGLKL